jgi:hypothetical protein
MAMWKETITALEISEMFILEQKHIMFRVFWEVAPCSHVEVG